MATEPRRHRLAMSQKQREFLCGTVSPKFDSHFFGGARGTNKTRTLATACTQRALEHPNSLHLMLRRVRTSSELNMGRELKRVFEWMGLPFGRVPGAITYNSQKHQYVFPNGSAIILGYCLNDSDWEQFQGLELATTAWDEVTQFPEMAWDRIGASGRSGAMGLRGIRIAGGNPGGLGHEWVLRRLINPETRDRRVNTVLSSLAESPTTLELDPGYALRTLRSLPASLRAQWEFGDWNAVVGAYFSVPPSFWQHVDVPEWASIYAGVDAGYWPSAFAAVWVACWTDAEGRRRLHVVRDYKRHRMDAHQQADECLIIEDGLDLPVEGRYADSQAWMRTERSGHDGGINTASMWASRGWTCSAAPKTPRSDGWMTIRTMMREGVLTAEPRCNALRYELLSAMCDPRVDDIEGGADDHILDALRYMINARYSAIPRRRPAAGTALRPKRPRKSRPTVVMPAATGPSLARYW